MLGKTICLAMLFLGANALPGGAPGAACQTMTPQHYPATPQPLDESPYEVSASVSADNEVTVTLSGTSEFRGILLQARTSQAGDPMGSWVVPSGTDLFKRLSCSGNDGAALTHTSRLDKAAEQTFMWVPPEIDSETSFTIYATVVTNTPEFYVQIPSEAITIQPMMSGTTPAAPIPATPAAPTPATPAAPTPLAPTTVAPMTTTSSANKVASSLFVWNIIFAVILFIQTNIF